MIFESLKINCKMVFPVEMVHTWEMIEFLVQFEVPDSFAVSGLTCKQKNKITLSDQ